MKIKYQNLIFRSRAVEIIEKANAIIEEYEAQGHSLTLRQLYYQFVARDLFPAEWASKATGSTNCQESYDKLGSIISNARRAGLISWTAIVDRTRFLRTWGTHYSSPAEAIASLSRKFKVDLWAGQKHYVEVWFEKDALLGVFERASQFRRLPLISCRGYGSDSTWWEAAQRIREVARPTYILHFGDHDPSGLDMTRDIEERLNLFGAFPKVKRLALNMSQVKKYNPPPNPAKETDSRFEDYRAKFGNKSWELDALPPDIFVKMVEGEVAKLIDEKQWTKQLKAEESGKEQLVLISDNFPVCVRAATENEEKHSGLP